MKTYTLSFADSTTHKPEHPDRTARRSQAGMSFDVVYQVWTNRAAMARSMRMQQRRAGRQTDWCAVMPLSDEEGY